MLYPLSYSRDGRQCSKDDGLPRAAPEARGLPDPAKLHSVLLRAGTLYRGGGPILACVRRCQW